MHNKWKQITRNLYRSIVLLVLAGLLLIGCSTTPKKTSQTKLLLGTTITVTIYGKAKGDAFTAVFDRVAEVERKMSTSREDYTTTELLAVNDAAGKEPVHVSADTFAVVQEALDYSEQTDGRFDVAIQPLVALWGIGTDHAKIPAPDAISEALFNVDYHKVVLDPEAQTIYLPDPGMGIDVGGIAKGYAADEAERILKEHEVKSAILDFGGNILTLGTKPDGSDWRIGIQVPDATRGEYLGVAEVVDKAVVTSGTYERFFIQDGVRYHHILDSTTGFPVQNGLDSVTIITANSTQADALSTSIFAMGIERGMQFVENLDGVEALFVTTDKKVTMTSGMGDYFTLTNEAFTMVDEATVGAPADAAPAADNAGSN